MVALHQDCSSLRLEECSRAVAGGANLITNLALFDAMHTGGFLSKTGACKRFDAAADGYCRGEAVDVVVLKPLAGALADKENIHDVILATGNNQNTKGTTIINPVLESQAALYRHVLKRAGLSAKDVSYVEAHGTGTRAGDLVEMGSIRQVLGESRRATTLHVGSLKANIGHSEERQYGAVNPDSIQQLGTFPESPNECNEAMELLNLLSLFPAVLQRLQGERDLILRHAAIFAIQYSSGMCWLESGLKLQAVCGHSFGEWAAATVSGVMTLKGGMKLVTGFWGEDPGAMVAVEADLVNMKRSPEQYLEPFYESYPLVRLSVACYNGPNNYVVASSTPDVEVLESYLKARELAGEALRFKVLKGMHAYHSPMADPILDESAKLSETIQFKTRDQGQDQGLNVFVPVDGKDPAASLAEAVAILWRSGISNVQFWPFHKIQQAVYSTAVLPPYQFDKNRHWLDYAPGWNASDFPYIAMVESRKDTGTATFKVDPRSRRYQEIFQGHNVVGSPICPVAMYLELATLGVSSLTTMQGLSMTVENLTIKAPLGLDTVTSISLTMTTRLGTEWEWDFQLSSTRQGSKPTLHAAGIVALKSTSRNVQDDNGDIWAATTRLLDQKSDADALRGATVYKMFSAMYRDLRHLAAKGGEAAGDITIPTYTLDPVVGMSNRVIADPIVLDTFLQVLGIFVHSLRDVGQDGSEEEQGDMSYICTGIGSVRPMDWPSPSNRQFMVYARIVHEDQRIVVLDVSALGKNTRRPVWSVEALQFARVPRVCLAKALAEVKVDIFGSEQQQPSVQQKKSVTPQAQRSKLVHQAQLTLDPPVDLLLNGVREILARCLDMEAQQITREATLDDLGADSLIGPEVAANLSNRFNARISMDDFAQATDVASLCALVSMISQDGDLEASHALRPSDQVMHRTCEILGDSLGLESSDIQPDSKLEDLGIDSLVPVEIISNPKEAFNTDITSSELASATDVAYVDQLVTGLLSTSRSSSTSLGLSTPDVSANNGSESFHNAFLQVRGSFDYHANDTKLTGYWDLAYPEQLNVVAEKEKLSDLEAGFVEKTSVGFLRGATKLTLNSTYSSIRPARELSRELIVSFPQFASAHGLAALLGPHLAECLTGQSDPITILFGSDASRALLDDSYANGPDLRAATHVLCDFIAAAICINAMTGSNGEPSRVLEVQATGLPFTYTFTDVSVSLVARAKKSPLFRSVPKMDFCKLDIEEAPPLNLLGSYHLVISSNCVYATRDLKSSLLHIRQLLRPRDGCLALVELTQKQAWYDLLWGFLDGWWLFDYVRTHVLQSPWALERYMPDAGFSHLDWSEGVSRESRGVRVICGLVADLAHPSHINALNETQFCSSPILGL
ncbi:polyketide synthase [Fusarium mexicanum]|uniref:Polyketide synthase n=1 Tax=Fusarium mexicanum TaxID=751941 RepID=A0A8H5IBY5_9HYPO|nr:polyketide synthase [Fusarium mexicanum]